MYLVSMSTAVPEQHFTQPELWQIYQQTPAYGRMRDASNDLIRRVLTGNSGIDKRHFAATEVETLFDRDAEELNLLFERTAPKLAVEALAPSLDQAEWTSRELDALFVCTCTGYLCPGLSSYVAQQLGLRSDAFLMDVVGQGCGAAIPTLRNASAFVAQNPNAKVATIAVEICSAAFYLDDDAGVIISACIFGDGAAATLWQGRPLAGAWSANAFDTLHQPEARETLRFRNRQGKLRNILKPSVPQTAADAVRTLFLRYCQRFDGPQEIVTHGGGRDVILEIDTRIPGYEFSAAESVMRQYGNLSSPSVLFALSETLRTKKDLSSLWLASFGAGFSAHSMDLRRTD